MSYRLPLTTSVRTILVALGAVFVSGCATLSADGGADAVSSLTRERIGEAVQRQANEADTAAANAVVERLLSAPLTAEAAVRIALINNQGLQASFGELGVAESDMVLAGRLRNPSFSLSRLRNGEDIEIGRSIIFDLVGLLTMPVRSGIERGRYESMKLRVASEAVKLAADTRRAWVNAVAAQQTALYMEQAKDAAEAGAELGQRMAKAGNWSKLDQAREQAFYADATAQLARARHQAAAAREQLTRLLGLWGKRAAFRLPDRLPDLPGSPKDMTDIESEAMRQRLDVQMAKRDAEATARALGLTRATGFINVFHAGYLNKSETGNARSNGYEIELELPLFDWGGAKTAKAEALYMQSVHRTAEVAVRARSQVREAYSAYRTSYDLARHYRDEIVPLRKKISEEMLLRYNGMLVGVFELLADARTQIASVNAAIEAQRDYWLADSDLQMAINGNGGAVTEMRTTSAPAEQQGH